MSVTGIILAAGSSTRMGEPKSLLVWRGELFLDRLIRLLSAVCSEVMVVLGEHEVAIRRASQLLAGTKVMINHDPSRGQFSSLQLALAECPGPAIFTLVDHPAVDASTLERLAQSLANPDIGFAIPRYLGKRGHPVAASAAMVQELKSWPADGWAKQVIDADPSRVLYLEVDDAGVTLDLDTPDEYQAATRAASEAS